MKQGEKIMRLDGKVYYISRILRNDRFLIESNNDCIILSKSQVKLNFKEV